MSVWTDERFSKVQLPHACLSALHVSLFAPEQRIDRVGLPLCAVRDPVKSDFEATFAKVADGVGYKEIEFAGLFHHAPKAVGATRDREGLTAPSGLVSYAVVETKWPETLEAAHAIDQ